MQRRRRKKAEQAPIRWKAGQMPAVKPKRGWRTLFRGLPGRAGAEAAGMTRGERNALGRIPFLRRLNTVQKERFFTLAADFLQRVQIVSVEGSSASDEERAKIAGSCALLYVGRPGWPFPPVQRVFLSGRSCAATDRNGSGRPARYRTFSHGSIRV
ncbi:MAG: zinc-dependent peptidase [Kiritimatiellae bacterium]|nr:zinc-dependent peptidase [Kiritimatiellia bacterium]